MPRTSHGSLTANVVKTVPVHACTTQITIVNRSQAGEIYFTVDDTIPTVGGDNCHVCLGVATVMAPNYNTNTSVRLISTGALLYSVVGEPI